MFAAFFLSNHISFNLLGGWRYEKHRPFWPWAKKDDSPLYIFSKSQPKHNKPCISYWRSSFQFLSIYWSIRFFTWVLSDTSPRRPFSFSPSQMCLPFFFCFLGNSWKHIFIDIWSTFESTIGFVQSLEILRNHRSLLPFAGIVNLILKLSGTIQWITNRSWWQ